MDKSIWEESTFENFLECDTIPEWVKAIKLQAYRHFEKQAWFGPKDENWRFASKKHLREALEGDFFLGEKDSGAQSSLCLAEKEAFLLTSNNEVVKRELSGEGIEQGVIFESIERAFTEHAELLDTYCAKQTALLGGKRFLTLNWAFCKPGPLVFIPKGVSLKKPIYIEHQLNDENCAIFPHTLIIAEEGASGEVVEIFSGKASRGLSISASHLFLHPHSHIRRTCIQDFEKDVLGFSIENNTLQEGSTLEHTQIALGGHIFRSENVYTLEAHSKLEANFLNVLGENQENDIRTLQQHKARSAQSNILCKNIIRDNGHAIFAGNIDVGEEAKHTEAFQQNKNLLLSEDALVDTLPSLEIQTDDVRCSHGATVSGIDKDMDFYLKSRGINPKTSETMLSAAFASQILEKISQTNISEYIKNKM